MKNSMITLLFFVATVLGVQSASAAGSAQCRDEAKLNLKYALYNWDSKKVAYSAKVTGYSEGEDENGYEVVQWNFDVDSSIGIFKAYVVMSHVYCEYRKLELSLQ